LIVLITNCVLNGRTGTETFTRDLAFQLQAMGHRPVIYTQAFGDIARDIAARGIPVTDDITTIAGPIDVIHGHHTIPTAIAAIRFKTVPAIFVCHDFTAWHDAPPDLPSLTHYVALGRTSAQRLTYRAGIAPEKVTIIPNGVDTTRFRPGAALPPKPARALAFCRNTHFAALVQQACARRGIAVDLIGGPIGRPVADPERLIPLYDLVFASGRAAQEALVCERAVICCDERGLAGMVTLDAFIAWRGNLGLASLARALTVENLLAAIDEYNPDASHAVAARTNPDRSMERCATAYVALYKSAIADFSTRSPHSQQTEDAIVRLLQLYSPHKARFWPWDAERERLLNEARLIDRPRSEAVPSGVPLSFGQGGAVWTHCDLSSFHTPEDHHVWSSSNRCAIRFTVPPGVTDCTIQLHLSAILARGCDRNRITIACNAAEPIAIDIDRPATHDISLVMAGTHQHPIFAADLSDPERVLVDIALTVDATTIPGADDQRCLGVMLFSMTVTYQPSPAARPD
jgi:hypothetical protein